MRITRASRAPLALLLALLATSAALRMPVTPLRAPQLRAPPRQRAGTIQLVDEPSPEAEATEPAAAPPATGDAEPETVVVEFGLGFGDKSSPIWQEIKYAESEQLDKETPAALKFVLDFLCKWLMLEPCVGGMVGRGWACSSADLTLALCPGRGAFRPLCGSECCRRCLADQDPVDMPLRLCAVLNRLIIYMNVCVLNGAFLYASRSRSRPPL